jgi:hypothetical protein
VCGSRREPSGLSECRLSASFLFAIVTRLVNRETPFSGERAKPKFGIAAIGHGNHSDHVRSRKHPNNLRPTSVGTLAAPSHAAGFRKTDQRRSQSSDCLSLTLVYTGLISTCRPVHGARCWPCKCSSWNRCSTSANLNWENR